MVARFSVWDRVWPYLLASLLVGADRWSKLAIQHHLSAFDVIPIIPAWFRIVHTENTGAAFGVLAEGNSVLRAVMLLGVSGLVLAFVAIALWKRSRSSAEVFARVGLALVLGGAAGNLYDRVIQGSVTDFIEVYHGSWSFPAFNVADSCITVGAGLLLLEQLRSQKGKTSEWKAKASQSGD